MSYFISPPEQTDWRMDIDSFERDLRQKWPNATIERRPPSDSFHALTWTINGQNDQLRIDGAITRTGQTIHLDGDVHACAAFARWFRSKTPDAQPLLFYDESYSADVPLRLDTTEDQIAHPFLA
ncbi:MAG TPA: hypothetical protein VH877_13020 [Polyangia bacterium]|jgi:hypothetical protein|nr:hypothetical protein [Polyangia bacterium]